MAQMVRNTHLDFGCGLKKSFVYKGYYCSVGSSMVFHTKANLKFGTNVCDVSDDDVFTMANEQINDEKRFKEIIDEHIEYLFRAFGSPANYYKLNS